MKQADCIRETSIKKDLGSVLDVLNWAGMSRVYFGKSTAWLYHKLDGIDGNGKPCSFNEEEMELLKSSFKDLASKLNDLSENLNVKGNG